MALKLKGEVTVQTGLGLPRVTTVQRLAYTPSASGFAVYDTDLDAIFTWDGTAWNASGTAAPVDSVNGQTGAVVLTDSDIEVTPSGNLAATNVEAALLELQGDIDTLTALGAADYIAGSGVPASATGVDGNFYLDVATGDIYEKAGGTWTATGDNVYAMLALSSAAPLADGTASAGTGLLAAREDHVHPENSIDAHTDVDTSTAAPVVGDHLEWDGANWVPGSQPTSATYEQDFIAGDWVLGSPNVLTITAATHALPVKDNYDITVRDATGCLTLIENVVDGAGNVTLNTEGAAYAGNIKISC